tara:strand:+ start:1279 stop:1869 length:591 start_codon:yes stop_codon:yes gene_type:complete
VDIQILKTQKGNKIEGLYLLKPNLYQDDRGYFYESWNQREFQKLISKKIDFVQDNHSESCKGTLRGLHFQLNPFAQAKLVRCTKGEIYDVAVDLRKNSQSYGEWTFVYLNEKNKYQFWIPEGFAHGFLTLSERAEVQYKTNNFWSKESDKTLIWNDKDLNIVWPLKKINLSEPLLSEKDKYGLSFTDIKNLSYIFE